MTRHHEPARGRKEEGSALIIAALVAVILSLLGLSYLMMAQTENTIAENERNAAAALYVAEAGARLVVGWFNDPSSTGFLVPAVGAVDRTKRIFDNDNNTGTARVQGVSGNGVKPYYKDSAFTTSPIFDRPYRSDLANTFLGIETGTDPNVAFAGMGPDIIVNASHLTTINNTMFTNFPSVNLNARITRIEIYAPPLVLIGGSLTRMGVATVKVTAGIFMLPNTADERQIATRIVKAVVNEIPVPGPVGPLQSCSGLGYSGSFDIHWGTGSSVGDAAIPSAGSLDVKVPSGMPYALNDPFTYINGGSTLAGWATAHTGQAVDDPWFKYISGGTIDAATNTNVQPWIYNAATAIASDHSNLFQHTVINCPAFDYALWKSISQSGMKNIYYYKPSGANFQLDGTGTADSFENITNNRSGLMFFDTTDGLAPNVPGTNLTPAIGVSGGGWNTAGFVYLNASDFHTNGVGTGVNRTVVPPGEPGDGSGFVNFTYPSSLTGGYTIHDGSPNLQTFWDGTKWYCTDASQCDTSARIQALAPVQDDTGLPFTAGISVYGVMYISGTFSAAGNANYFGSVVAQRGVIDGTGDPAFYFDERLVKGQWPPPGMALPRVVVSSWQTDL
jgi:Tfp pilus assembly protein PilX